jgi:hypothetical protein
MTFTVHPDQQAVVVQTESIGPNRLVGCAVVDRNNWKCNGSSGGSVGFTKGRFWERADESAAIVVSGAANYIRYGKRSEWLSAEALAVGKSN